MENIKFIKVIIKNLILLIIFILSCSKIYASNELFSLWLDNNNSPKYQFIQGFNPNKGVVIIYEDNNNTIWSVHSRQGFIEPYESGKIKWVPVDSNSSEIEKIRLKNKPLLDSFELKQKEEIEAIEKEFY